MKQEILPNTSAPTYWKDERSKIDSVFESAMFSYTRLTVYYGNGMVAHGYVCKRWSGDNAFSWALRYRLNSGTKVIVLDAITVIRESKSGGRSLYTRPNPVLPTREDMPVYKPVSLLEKGMNGDYANHPFGKETTVSEICRRIAWEIECEGMMRKSSVIGAADLAEGHAMVRQGYEELLLTSKDVRETVKETTDSLTKRFGT